MRCFSGQVVWERTLMYRKFLCMLGIAFTVVGIPETPSRGQTASGNISPPRERSAAEAYQNIQVLKDMPADQLVPAMQFITYSLGVECSYCHVEGAFEKDDKKPKQAARKMMQMMFAINHDTFEGKREVTCYSCHRGSAHPVATPVIADSVPPVSQVPVESVT